MTAHLFVSDIDGALYDTRSDDWHKGAPLRANYKRHHTLIETVSDLKATLRAGAHTNTGGYPLYFITNDGAALSFATVRAEFRIIAQEIRDDWHTGWRVQHCAINYEDSALFCEHSGEKIESAYGEESADRSFNPYSDND